MTAAQGQEKDVIQAFRLGASDYISMPIREAEVVAAVTRALQTVHARKERERLARRLERTNKELEIRVQQLTTLFTIGKAILSTRDQGELFNPQQQFPVTWPAVPVVARAYLDQLERGDALTADSRADFDAALDSADARLGDDAKDAELAARLESMAASLGDDDGDAANAKRRAALADTLTGIAASLR